MKKLIFLSLLCWAVACSGNQEQAAEAETSVVTETPEKEQPVAEAKPAAQPGKGIYIQYCQVCHQANGEGMAGNYPPLAGEWVNGDKTRLINVILNGLEGEIEVNGQKWDNIMASHSFLTDKQIADVLTYIRSNFGNDAEAVTPAEVTAVRASGS